MIHPHACDIQLAGGDSLVSHLEGRLVAHALLLFFLLVLLLLLCTMMSGGDQRRE